MPVKECLLYDGTAAASYAVTWAKDRNPMWPSGAPAFKGGDCSNFVSQALYAGGWPMIWSGDAPHLEWWCTEPALRSKPENKKRGTASGTWGSADNFRRFLQHSSRARPCKISELDLGDVMQLFLGNYDFASHTMMVTSKLGGQILLSYHSANERNMPLQDVMAKSMDGTRFISWKILDTFSDDAQRFTHP